MPLFVGAPIARGMPSHVGAAALTLLRALCAANLPIIAWQFASHTPRYHRYRSAAR